MNIALQSFEVKNFIVENCIENLGKENPFKRLDFQVLRQLFSRSRYKIEGKTKMLITLRWN